MKLAWDTEIDTPATIAIVGGGAVGIEAALYARFLGYYVLLIEAGKMANLWRSWGQLAMLAPYGDSASRLGRAALAAHQPDVEPFAESEVLTAHGFAEHYLIPLARTDLIYDCVQVHTRVHSISRTQYRRESNSTIDDRAESEFRLVLHSKNRGWFTERADIVLDCSGVDVSRSLGPGGGLAIGEIESAASIACGYPDLLNKRRAEYAGKRILLVGAGLAALVNMTGICQLIQSEPTTKLTWLIPHSEDVVGPDQLLSKLNALGDEASRLTSRTEIAAALTGEVPGVIPLPGLGVERILSTANGLAVTLLIGEDSTLDIECDRIINNVGYQADWQHVAALRIGRSSHLDRPRLDSGPDCWDSLPADTADTPGIVEAPGPCEPAGPMPANIGSLDLAHSILTMEPHYYVLGSKSFGLAHDRFTLRQGHEQIREAFALIGGRAELDLYRQISQSPS